MGMLHNVLHIFTYGIVKTHTHGREKAAWRVSSLMRKEVETTHLW